MAYRAAVLDDSADMRLMMASLLRTMLNVECLEIGSVEDLKHRASEVLATEVIFLDINLGMNQASGIDAHHWLCAQRYAGRIYFLTGHARHHPLVAAAVATGAEVLEKPIKASELTEIVRATIE